MNRTFRLHLMSASIGETTHNLARACLVQFENLEINTLEHYQIQIEGRAGCVLAAIKECPGAVIYRALNEKLSAALEQGGSRLSIFCINVLGRITLKRNVFWAENWKNETRAALNFDKLLNK